jgi:hypothetical protein
MGISMIKPLRIEILFAGFIHLLWLTLLAFFISGESPLKMMNFLTTIGSGTALFLYAIIISVSFFLGTVAENFVIALNYLRKNKEQRNQSIKLLESSRSENWGSKSFFFSSSAGLLFLIVMLVFSNYIESCSVKWAITVIGVILLLGTVSSLCYWRHVEKIFNQK